MIATLIPVSIGEAIDRYSILSLKIKNTQDSNRKKVLSEERDIVEKEIEKNVKMVALLNNNLVCSLSEINEFLWKIENNIREAIKNKKDIEFYTQLIIFLNDQRIKYKQKINAFFGDKTIEEKIYPM
jgi:hypothetical protein